MPLPALQTRWEGKSIPPLPVLWIAGRILDRGRQHLKATKWHCSVASKLPLLALARRGTSLKGNCTIRHGYRHRLFPNPISLEKYDVLIFPPGDITICLMKGYLPRLAIGDGRGQAYRAIGPQLLCRQKGFALKKYASEGQKAAEKRGRAGKKDNALVRYDEDRTGTTQPSHFGAIYKGNHNPHTPELWPGRYLLQFAHHPDAV